MKDKKQIYNNVVNCLMANDSNGTWNETLQDADNNLNYAIHLTKLALVRILNELKDDSNKDEYNYYNTQLQKLNEVK